MEQKFKFEKVLQNFNRVKTDLPRVMANQAQNFFADNFRKQGFDDGTLQPWEQVKRKTEGTPEYKYPKNKGLSRRTKPILEMSGALHRAVGMSARAGYASFDTTVLRVPLEYAAAQNDGNPKKNIPARKFMGNSATLTKMQYTKINEFIDKIWKS